MSKTRIYSAVSLAGAALVLALGVAGARADELVNTPAATSQLGTLPPPPSWGGSPGAGDEPLAPIGVFGANLPGAGHVTFAFSSVYSKTEGNLIGATSVSPNFIVSNIYSNRTPVSPKSALLRVVPLKGDFYGQFGSVAVGVTDDFAVVGSLGYVYKDKDLLTYKGTTGLTQLGTSLPYTDGVSDTTVAGVYRIYKDDMNRVLVSFGVSLPTGGYQNYWTPLSPAGTYPTKVAVYGMQEGLGSVAALPGITYKGFIGPWSWGLAYRGVMPLANNPDGWRFGNINAFSGWAGYSWLPGLATTARLDWINQGQIHGQGADILGYAQGNVPQFYGGNWMDVNLGVSVSGSYIGLPKATVQAEFGIPIYQNLNGPQSAAEWSGILRVQYRL